VIEPGSRGVLDPRLRGDDEGVLHRYRRVIASAAKQSIYPRIEEWIALLRSQ
jgi:hypothetical protein